MKSREKVAEALEFCLKNQRGYDCGECPYGGRSSVICDDLINDAINALHDKENCSYNSTGWIFTEKKMPSNDEQVLVWVYGNYEIGCFEKDPDNLQYRWSFEYFNLYGDDIEDVEAWMPLSKPYKD